MQDTVFCILSLFNTDHRYRHITNSCNSAYDRTVICKTAVTMHLYKIQEHIPDIIYSGWTFIISGSSYSFISSNTHSYFPSLCIRRIAAMTFFWL